MPVDLKRTLRTSWILFAVMATSSLCGCSLFVMAGKSLFGDPKVEAPFSHAANVDLTDGLHKVVIVASTPEAIKYEFPATNVDLIEKVSRNLRTEGVQVVNPNKVATWLDDHGGYWEDINELAGAFECDYIIHLEVDNLSLREPNSRDMYQGHVAGTVYGYEVRQRRKDKVAHRIFHKAFDRTYPDGYPKLADRLSEDSFHRELMDHIAVFMTQMIVDHRTSERIF